MSNATNIQQEERDRLRGLIRALSHELRTPLGSVLMQAQLLEFEIARDSPAGNRVEGILRGCKQLSRMLDDLADMLLAESGQLRLRRESVDLERFLPELHQRVPGLRLENVRFVSLGHTLPVACDPDRLDRILVNLLCHVLDHVRDNNPVMVTLRTEAGRTHIEIAARGIAPEPNLDGVFEEFLRNRRSCRDEGVRLGLYIAWLLAKAIEGRIAMDADGQDGSVFALSLPVASRRNDGSTGG